MLCISLNHLSLLLVFVQTGANVVRVASELLYSQDDDPELLILLPSLLSAEITGMCYHLAQVIWFWRLKHRFGACAYQAGRCSTG